MKIYIAGPMRGKECFNFESFFYMARRLKDAGFDVINPAQIDTEKMFNGWVYSNDQYAQILLRDLEIISDGADAIMLLEGFEKSPGAMTERALAIALKIPLLSEYAIKGNEMAMPFSTLAEIIESMLKAEETE